MSERSAPDQFSVRYLERPGTAKALIGTMVLVGAVSFVATLFADPSLAWKSYVVNWNYFASISLGGVIVAAVTWITKAKWNQSVRRLHQSFAAYLPIAFALFIPMLAFLREDYFPWIDMMENDPIVQKKAAWLNTPFLVARNAVGVLALFGLALGFVYLALRPDLGGRDRSGRAESGAGTESERRARWRERLAGDWAGQAAEEARSYRRMTRMAPVLVLAFVIVMTVLAFDWAMSLEPHWFSTLFGGWFFMGAFWGGLAATAVAAVWLKGKDREFDKHMGSAVLWDLGKLVFAFTVFWTYLFWSQYIVIWYGKLPWEQAWVATRSGEPWGGLSAAVIVLCFVVPFAGLLGVRPKKTGKVLQAFALVVLVGLWLWHYMLVFPSLHHEGDPVFSHWTPLIGVGFLGLFMWAVRWFLATFPVIQVWQPPVDPEPMEAEGWTPVVGGSEGEGPATEAWDPSPRPPVGPSAGSAPAATATAPPEASPAAEDLNADASPEAVGPTEGSNVAQSGNGEAVVETVEDAVASCRPTGIWGIRIQLSPAAQRDQSFDASQLVGQIIKVTPRNGKPFSRRVVATGAEPTGGTVAPSEVVAYALPVPTAEEVAHARELAPGLSDAAIRELLEAQAEEAESRNPSLLATSDDLDTDSGAKALQTVAKEAWRLERVCGRLLTTLPFNEQKRYDGRLRWFRKQLDSALEDAGMRLVSIEGQRFEVGTAATALNIEDFREADTLVVDKMIEPILMGPDGILQMGTVTVKRAEL